MKAALYPNLRSARKYTHLQAMCEIYKDSDINHSQNMRRAPAVNQQFGNRAW